MSAEPVSRGHLRAAPVTADAFRATFRDHAAGVVVVTAGGPDASPQPVGFTATSLASVSLEPPMLSFAIARGSSAWPVLATSERIAVHFLHEEQAWVAQRFATRGVDRFAAPVRWDWSVDGEPVLQDCAAFLACRVTRHVDAGDHVVVLAEVVGASLADVPATDGSPLVYHAGSFARLSPVPPLPTATAPSKGNPS